MTWYLKFIDLEVWKTISYGYIFPTKDVDGNKFEKPLDEYNDEEKKKFQLNSKAMYILACARDRTEFNIICQCKTTKKVWRILKITYEGTNQVKDSSDDEEEIEIANLCFMALEDQDEVNSNSDDEELMFEYDELLKFIYKLDEKNTLRRKFLSIKKNLIKSKKILQKLKLQKSLLRRKMKSY